MSEEISDVLEGFLCPICKQDLKTPDQLSSHFDSEHSTDKDVLKSFKGFVGKAKKKILNIDESDLESFKTLIRTPVSATENIRKFYDDEQEIGQTRSQTDYFKAVRGARLEHFASETNKFFIRLDRLVNNDDNGDRRQHEQNVVQWLDGTSVKLCPSCARSFNITRRQHHCRLCGSVMCHDCSCFLSIGRAKIMTAIKRDDSSMTEKEISESIRLCKHCLHLLETRHALHERRQAKPIVVSLYNDLRSVLQQTAPLCALYKKMCTSLFCGESTFSLPDAQALRGNIARHAEEVDAISQKIAAIPGRGREVKLYQTIRRSTALYLKEKVLCLPQLPTKEEIEELKKSKPKIVMNETTQSIIAEPVTLSGWSLMSQPAPMVDLAESDPLIVQMDVIRGYIKEARKALRFEELVILEENLQELQNEFLKRERGKVEEAENVN